MSDQHKEIECELLEIYNKNLDRFFSLIKFIFLIFGVYILTLSSIYGKFDIHAFENAETISFYSLLASLLFVSIALIVPFSQLLIPRERRFKQTENAIQFRNEEEAKIYNKKLYMIVRQQENYYVTSFLLVLLSFIFFCGHFVSFAICISIPVLIISVFHYLTFTDWIKKENKEIRILHHEG